MLFGRCIVSFFLCVKKISARRKFEKIGYASGVGEKKKSIPSEKTSNSRRHFGNYDAFNDKIKNTRENVSSSDHIYDTIKKAAGDKDDLLISNDQQ